MVPLAGIEPALLAELDFESSASTNSATGAFRASAGRPRLRSRRNIAGAHSGSTRAGTGAAKHSSVIAFVSTALAVRDRTLPQETDRDA